MLLWPCRTEGIPQPPILLGGTMSWLPSSHPTSLVAVWLLFQSDFFFPHLNFSSKPYFFGFLSTYFIIFPFLIYFSMKIKDFIDFIWLYFYLFYSMLDFSVFPLSPSLLRPCLRGRQWLCGVVPPSTVPEVLPGH